MYTIDVRFVTQPVSISLWVVNARVNILGTLINQWSTTYFHYNVSASLPGGQGCLGKSESTCLKPMWPVFDSRICGLNLLLVLVFSRQFSLGDPFPSILKSTFLILTSIQHQMARKRVVRSLLGVNYRSPKSTDPKIAPA